MDVLQEVGSYAGFAAVIGLAVLSALYFSQARDLRRLREWAGRAPERAAEQAAAAGQELPAPEEAAQRAVRPPASGAVRPIPAAKPAAASAAGAKPAAATQPAGPPSQEEAGKDEPPKPAVVPAAATAAAAAGTTKAPETASPQPGPAPATPAASPGAAKPPKAPAPTPAGSPPSPPSAPSRPPLVPRTPPPRPPGRPAPVGRTAAQSTAVLPPSSRVRGAGPPSGRKRGLEPRYIALIVAGVIVVGGGAAFAVSQLGGDDGGAAGEQPPAAEQPAGPLNRSLVTVSVLNGTTVPGLAAQIGDDIESKGFQRGNVANAIDQQRAESVVLFAEGAERPARIVARSLDISQIEPVDPDSQALAGNASVVVIVGADQTQ